MIIQLGMTLLPIIPILLLPFIIILFVIVVPVWFVALGVVGLVLVVILGADWLARTVGIHTLTGPTARMRRAFRWVLTFGGLARPRAEATHDVQGRSP